MPNARVDLTEFDELVYKVRECKLARLFKELDGEDRAKLIAALDAGFSASVIRRWLGSRGFKLGDKAVTDHRKGECCCDRPE